MHGGGFTNETERSVKNCARFYGPFCDEPDLGAILELSAGNPPFGLLPRAPLSPIERA